jgi:hypothetical protein
VKAPELLAKYEAALATANADLEEIRRKDEELVRHTGTHHFFCIFNFSDFKLDVWVAGCFSTGGRMFVVHSLQLSCVRYRLACQ